MQKTTLFLHQAAILQFANCNIRREKQYLQSGYELQNII